MRGKRPDEGDIRLLRVYARLFFKDECFKKGKSGRSSREGYQTQQDIQEGKTMLKTRLGHVTLFAENPDLLAEFYRDLFGMEIVGKASSGSSVFIGGHLREENHELAFIHNRKGAHIGLKVSSPGELLASYQEVKARGLNIFALYNHGMALALYVPDPEGNLIEIYWPTGREDYHPPTSDRLTWRAR